MKEKRDVWLNALGLKDEEVSKYATVCSRHFLENYIDKSVPYYTKLKNNAVPCVSIIFIILDNDLLIKLYN